LPYAERLERVEIGSCVVRQDEIGDELVEAEPTIRESIPRITRCGVEPKIRRGRYRWVVERTRSRLNRFRRLKIRCEHRADIQLAILQLGCALISLRFLGSPRPTRENGRPGPPRTASAILGT
jgi:hypothetical protein